MVACTNNSDHACVAGSVATHAILIYTQNGRCKRPEYYSDYLVIEGTPFYLASSRLLQPVLFPFFVFRPRVTSLELARIPFNCRHHHQNNCDIFVHLPNCDIFVKTCFSFCVWLFMNVLVAADHGRCSDAQRSKRLEVFFRLAASRKRHLGSHSVQTLSCFMSPFFFSFVFE